MRTHVLVLPLLLALGACGSDGGSGGDDAPEPDGGGIEPPARGFQIVSPDITIEPGQEITYCYYFRTPNTEDLVIKKWTSSMTPGSHHMIMYTTTSDSKPPGTVSDQSCGNFSVGNIPSWTYAAQNPEAEVALPPDDGNGVPLGQEIPANTAGYFQMHYLNATDEPIQAHVTLNAVAHEAGVAYTKTAPYITYNAQISIPPNAMGDVERMTCAVPAGVKFWSMSTHSHKQSVATSVKDGQPNSSALAFESTDWEHPGSETWMQAPFFTFATNQLTYECRYNNIGSNSGSTVSSGPSAETDEMCMATGYYFPATKPLICLNNLGPF